MTTPIFVANFNLVAGNDDLPRPETAAAPASAGQHAPTVLPRPAPSVNDTGRISFGAACRLPVTQ